MLQKLRLVLLDPLDHLELLLQKLRRQLLRVSAPRAHERPPPAAPPQPLVEGADGKHAQIVTQVVDALTQRIMHRKPNLTGDETWVFHRNGYACSLLTMSAINPEVGPPPCISAAPPSELFASLC